MTRESKTQAFLINTMIFLYFLYMISFSHIPDAVRVGFAGMLLALQTVSTCVAMALGMKRYSFVLLFIILLFILNSTIYPIIFEFHGKYDYNSVSRIIISFIFAVQVVLSYDKISIKLISFLTIFSMIYVIIWVVVNPTFVLIGVRRISTFTGLKGYVQTSSSTVSMLLLILHRLHIANKVDKRWFKILLIPTLVIIYLYKVSSVYIFVLLYFGGYTFFKTNNMAYRSFMLVFGFVMATGIIVHHEMRDGHTSATLDTVGNGRLESYTERFGVIASSGIPNILFGNGPGSDWRANDTWNNETASHSDLFALSIEYGLFGLSLVIMFLTIIIKKIDLKTGTPLFVSMILSSIITVGLFYRPSIFPFFWIAIGIALQDKITKSSVEEKPIPSPQLQCKKSLA